MELSIPDSVSFWLSAETERKTSVGICLEKPFKPNVLGFLVFVADES